MPLPFVVYPPSSGSFRFWHSFTYMLDTSGIHRIDKIDVIFTCLLKPGHPCGGSLKCIKCDIPLLLVSRYNSVCVCVSQHRYPHVIMRVVTWLSWWYYRSSMLHLNLSLIKKKASPDEPPHGVGIHTWNNRTKMDSEEYRFKAPVFWPKRHIHTPIGAASPLPPTLGRWTYPSARAVRGCSNSTMLNTKVHRRHLSPAVMVSGSCIRHRKHEAEVPRLD